MLIHLADTVSSDTKNWKVFKMITEFVDVNCHGNRHMRYKKRKPTNPIGQKKNLRNCDQRH